MTYYNPTTLDYLLEAQRPIPRPLVPLVTLPSFSRIGQIAIAAARRFVTAHKRLRADRGELMVAAAPSDAGAVVAPSVSDRTTPDPIVPRRATHVVQR